VLGVVGENGAGKTMTALSILRLAPFPGEIVAGSITYMGRDLLNVDRDEICGTSEETTSPLSFRTPAPP
jgi:ABC-type glutathione transport system ATPase component